MSVDGGVVQDQSIGRRWRGLQAVIYFLTFYIEALDCKTFVNSALTPGVYAGLIFASVGGEMSLSWA